MTIRVNYVRRAHGLTIYLEGFECQLIVPLKMPSTILDEFINSYVDYVELPEDDPMDAAVAVVETIGDEFDELLEKVHNFGVLEIPEHLRAPLAELKETMVQIQTKLQGEQAPKEKT